MKPGDLGEVCDGIMLEMYDNPDHPALSRKLNILKEHTKFLVVGTITDKDLGRAQVCYNMTWLYILIVGTIETGWIDGDFADPVW